MKHSTEISPELEGQESLLDVSVTFDNRGNRTVTTTPRLSGFDPRIDLPAPSRADAHGTSKAAAKSVRTGTWRWKVLDILYWTDQDIEGGGLTHDELEDYFQTTRSTPRARCAELVDMGYVEDSGKTRRNKYGKLAIVWCITDAGIDTFHRIGEAK